MVHFLVRPTTAFELIFNAYCTKTNVARDSVRFLYDSERITDSSTPEDFYMEAGAEIEARPVPAPANGGMISLKIKDQDGGEIHFRVRHTTVFSSIFTAYCAKKNMSQDGIRFLFDGSRIRGTDTPLSLELEDDDSIDAMMAQIEN